MTIHCVTHIGKLCTLEGAVKKNGRFIKPEDLGVIHDGALIAKDGKVAWVGAQKDFKKALAEVSKSKKTKVTAINAKGCAVLPGFVDSHTHLVFAGERSIDFEAKLSGKTYQEIAASGGGILRTMHATRSASKKMLVKMAKENLQLALKQGVTTIEIKTGYGLSLKSEKKLLEVISDLKKTAPQKILATFLGAHAVPPEFQGQADKYIKEISSTWLPKLKKHIDFIDAFIDAGFFTPAHGAELFDSAKILGIPVKLHADEIELSGGTDLAVATQAYSADHLLKIQNQEIQSLANSEVTATLLPTTAFYLKEGFAPARKLLEAGARVALASDFNPGTSPCLDVSLVAQLASGPMAMGLEEIIVALTLNGAYALGLQTQKGALLPGFDADFVVYSNESIAEFFYRFGQRTLNHQVFIGGEQAV